MFIFTRNLTWQYPAYIHVLVVSARQLDSVAQLVRALHRNRRAAGTCVAFFAAVPD